MTINVRLMTLQETVLIIEYFHAATPEHLEMLGVDPTRLPPASQWQRLYEQMFDHPIEQRGSLLVSWLSDDKFFGFSTATRSALASKQICTFITDPSLRRQRGRDTHKRACISEKWKRNIFVNRS